MERLLDPNPLFRAGAGREGAAEIKAHPWFAGFDWDKFAGEYGVVQYGNGVQ